MSDREATMGEILKAIDDRDTTRQRKRGRSFLKGYFPDFDQRDLDWLLFNLTGIDPDILKNDELHELLEDQISDEWDNTRSFKKFVDRKKEERRSSIIEDISWIDKKNDRLLIYLINRLTQLNFGSAAFFETVLDDISFKNLYRIFFKMLDFMVVNHKISPATKRERLMLIKKMWPLQKTPSKSLAWIDTKNLAQLEWIYEYLTEKNCLAQGPFPEKADEYLNIIHASFDLMSVNKQSSKLIDYGQEFDRLKILSRRQVTHYFFDVDKYKLESKEHRRSQKSRLDADAFSTEGRESKRRRFENQQLQDTEKPSPPEDKFAFLLSMKKAWDQRQLRANQKEHDPYQALSRQAKIRLKKLARQGSCTETQMLEKLINASEDLSVPATTPSSKRTRNVRTTREADEQTLSLDQAEIDKGTHQVLQLAENTEISDRLDDTKTIVLRETTDTESEGDSVIEETSTVPLSVAAQDSIEETDTFNVDPTPVIAEKDQLDRNHEALAPTVTVKDQVVETQLSSSRPTVQTTKRKQVFPKSRVPPKG